MSLFVFGSVQGPLCICWTWQTGSFPRHARLLQLASWWAPSTGLRSHMEQSRWCRWVHACLNSHSGFFFKNTGFNGHLGTCSDRWLAIRRGWTWWRGLIHCSSLSDCPPYRSCSFWEKWYAGRITCCVCGGSIPTSCRSSTASSQVRVPECFVAVAYRISVWNTALGRVLDLKDAAPEYYNTYNKINISSQYLYNYLWGAARKK